MNRLRTCYEVFAVCALLFFLIVLLTGCTSTIALRHPDGRTATCGDSYAYGIHSFAAVERDRACVQDFQRQGYERVAR